MTTYTPRLKLAKPNPVGEVVSVELFNQNADELDKYAGGPFRCTSTTRPAEPYVGLTIFETDTGFTLLWNGTEWTGTPYYIDRYRIGVAGAAAGTSFVPWNGTRHVTGTLAEWGLASATDGAALKAPATGLYSFDYAVRVDTVPSSALRVLVAGQEYSVAVNYPATMNTNAYSSQGLLRVEKGNTIQPDFFTSASTTIQPDVPLDANFRTYFKLRYLGICNA